jgi:3-deoxy-7-phosphoheptulonate synthase
VLKARKAIQNILSEKDDRLLVMVGPCSIHDPATAIEYAQRLKPLADELDKDLLVVMRAYLEKPVISLGERDTDGREQPSDGKG